VVKSILEITKLLSVKLIIYLHLPPRYIIFIARTESKRRYIVANKVIPFSVSCSNYSNITIIIITSSVRSNCRVINGREHKHVSL
jgi:hypothetical protein